MERGERPCPAETTFVWRSGKGFPTSALNGNFVSAKPTVRAEVLVVVEGVDEKAKAAVVQAVELKGNAGKFAVISLFGIYGA